GAAPHVSVPWLPVPQPPLPPVPVVPSSPRLPAGQPVTPVTQAAPALPSVGTVAPAAKPSSAHDGGSASAGAGPAAAPPPGAAPAGRSDGRVGVLATQVSAGGAGGGARAIAAQAVWTGHRRVVSPPGEHGSAATA